MIRASSRERWPSLTLTVTVAVAVSALALGCGPPEAPTIPLYPNAQTTRLPRSQIAEVAGPIGKIDGNDVIGWHGFFDLLPGCHVVELEHRLPANDPVLRRPGRAGGVYARQSGPFPITIYALRMKAGARYVIRRELYVEGGGPNRFYLSAREEQPDRAATDLAPTESAEDIKACNQWEATVLGR